MEVRQGTFFRLTEAQEVLHGLRDLFGGLLDLVDRAQDALHEAVDDVLAPLQRVQLAEAFFDLLDDLAARIIDFYELLADALDQGADDLPRGFHDLRGLLPDACGQLYDQLNRCNVQLCAIFDQ